MFEVELERSIPKFAMALANKKGLAFIKVCMNYYHQIKKGFLTRILFNKKFHLSVSNKSYF